MTSTHTPLIRLATLICLLSSFLLAFAPSAWAATLLQSTGSLDATVRPKLGTPELVLRCTYLYPADVQGQTYHIVSPGRYCFSADLNATPPSLQPVIYSPDSVRPTQSALHTGAAIHVHASRVEIDFGQHALNDSGKTPIQDGIRIDPGLDHVYVHNGLINGFDTGIAGNGQSALPISAIQIRNMQFFGSAIGAALISVRDSSIRQSKFTTDIMGLALSSADRIVVTANRFEFTTSSAGWIVGLYTSWGLRELTITDNVFNGRGQLNGLGIHLHNHAHHATNDQLSRDNRIKRNLFYAVQEPIVVTGSGVARNNQIRDNQIYGDSGPSIVRTYPVGYPNQFIAIRVEKNEDIEVSGNHIFTGYRVPYFYGIALGYGTTVKLDGNSTSTLRFNQTCGVMDPLVTPTGVPESSVDGGNYWNNLCRPPVIQ